MPMTTPGRLGLSSWHCRWRPLYVSAFRPDTADDDPWSFRPIRPSTADDDSWKPKVVELPLPMTILKRPKLVVLALPRTSRSRNAIPLCVSRWRDSQREKWWTGGGWRQNRTWTYLFEGGGGRGNERQNSFLTSLRTGQRCPLLRIAFISFAYFPYFRGQKRLGCGQPFSGK